jgi:hypothetical protein
MGARNRVGVGLSYRPAARLHRLAELIPWNRFLASLKVEQFGLSIVTVEGRGGVCVWGGGEGGGQSVIGMRQLYAIHCWLIFVCVDTRHL